MKLGRLIEGMEDAGLIRGSMDLDIAGIAYDSRDIRPGFLFVALRGHTLDGHAFFQNALERGAAALVGEEFPDTHADVAMVRVPDTRRALSVLADRFYDAPYRSMTLIGVTGTNGKTSTTYLLESILEASGARPGVIGTINLRYSGAQRVASMTTPESLDLMATLRDMADRGVTHVALEVSSHALDQGRIHGCPMEVAVFTNFSRDHLDYHKTMDAYFQAKSLLFRPPRDGGVPGDGPAVINMDDPFGPRLAALCERRVCSYGLGPECAIRAEIRRQDRDGLGVRIRTAEGDFDVRSRLIGRINIYNILASAAAALSLGVDPEAVAAGIRRLRGVPGRLERVENPRGLSLIVDYAHTPDALLKALETLRPLVRGRLITVFGCGGDRDRGKRPEMGEIAGRFSDVAVVTSDNPRTENPLDIIAQVEEGVQAAGLLHLRNGRNPLSGGYLVEPDRRRAIQLAVSAADLEDLVFIAGKGHEDYQILGTEKIHFDDREEAALAAGGCAGPSERYESRP